MCTRVTKSRKSQEYKVQLETDRLHTYLYSLKVLSKYVLTFNLVTSDLIKKHQSDTAQRNG